MMTEEMKIYLAGMGFQSLREMPDGRIAGLQRMIFTVGLFVGLSDVLYDQRYCYEYHADALKALETWDGTGDPPGPWIKEKVTERLGPGATAD